MPQGQPSAATSRHLTCSDNTGQSGTRYGQWVHHLEVIHGAVDAVRTDLTKSSALTRGWSNPPQSGQKGVPGLSIRRNNSGICRTLLTDCTGSSKPALQQKKSAPNSLLPSVHLVECCAGSQYFRHSSKMNLLLKASNVGSPPGVARKMMLAALQASTCEVARDPATCLT